MTGADDEQMRWIRAALLPMRHDQAGVSLVELLVAMTLGIVVLGAVVDSYVAIQLNVRVSAPSGRVVQYNDGVTLRNVPTS